MTREEELRNTFRLKSQGAMSLNIAFIGVVNGLFETLDALGSLDIASLSIHSGMDAGYVRRWAEAAYAFEYLEIMKNGQYTLTDQGRSMRPDHPDSLMPVAIGAIFSAHMADRAAELMRTGERPGEKVLGERKNILPWFGAMLEANFRGIFESEICPGVPVFSEINRKGGTVVDLGCGNGWYLRSLSKKCASIRGVGLDGFHENILQAKQKADEEGLSDRLIFRDGDIKSFAHQGPVDLISMNRALHHVWDEKETVFRILQVHTRPNGAVPIWEPAWPDDFTKLREPKYRHLAAQNLGEYVQGNHLLKPDEIAEQFREVGMRPEIYLFSGGKEAVIVGRKS